MFLPNSPDFSTELERAKQRAKDAEIAKLRIENEMNNLLQPNLDRVKQIDQSRKQAEDLAKNELQKAINITQQFNFLQSPYFLNMIKETEKNLSLELSKISQTFANLSYVLSQSDENQKQKSINLYQGYFVSPNSPNELKIYLDKVYIKKLKSTIVDKKIYQIYKQDSWQVLDFFKLWKGNKYLGKRLPAIKDAISILKQSKKSPHRVILPLLISQINGVLLDIAKKREISFEETTKKKDLKVKEDKKIRNEVLDLILLNLAEQNQIDLQTSLVFYLIENVLFSKSLTGKELENNPFYFNRHKIMHGEEVKGLTKPNMIRAFLLLDFLAQFLIEQ